MPITARGSTGCCARRLTTRSSVSLLTGRHQAFGKTGRGAATQGQSKMMDHVLQAASAPGQWRENAIG